MSNKEKIIRIGTWLTIFTFSVAFWVVITYYSYHFVRNLIMSN